MIMADEKIFTVPLRNVFQKGRKARSRRAITEVRDFLSRHMKAENIKIGKSINENIWERGIQKPPRRIRVHAIKEDNIVYSEIIGVEIKTPSKEEKKKKDDKKKEKKKRIKEERKERKKMSIQEEMAQESGVPSKPAEEKKEDKEAEKKTEEAKPAKESKEKETGKRATKGKA